MSYYAWEGICYVILLARQLQYEFFRLLFGCSSSQKFSLTSLLYLLVRKTLLCLLFAEASARDNGTISGHSATKPPPTSPNFEVAC